MKNTIVKQSLVVLPLLFSSLSYNAIAKDESYIVFENSYGYETISSAVEHGATTIFVSNNYPNINLYKVVSERKIEVFFEDGSYFAIYPALQQYEQKSAIDGKLHTGSILEANRPEWLLSSDNQAVYDDYQLFMQEQSAKSYSANSSLNNTSGLFSQKKTKDFGFIVSSSTSGSACSHEEDVLNNHAWDGSKTKSDCTFVEEVTLAGAAVAVLVGCGGSPVSGGAACVAALTGYKVASASRDRRQDKCLLSYKETKHAYDTCVATNTDNGNNNNTGGGNSGGGDGTIGSGNSGGSSGGTVTTGGTSGGGGKDDETCYRELPDGNGGTHNVIVSCS